jgi:hypothetical protein
LFPEDRCEAIVGDDSVVRFKLAQLRLERPRQRGGCWLELKLWLELGLHGFWSARLPPTRKGTRFDQVLAVLVCTGCSCPVANGVCIEIGLIAAHWLICSASIPADDDDKRHHGYSRDHRPDCVQAIIALVVTPQGFPLAQEVPAGNTADSTTLKNFFARIERQYGKARHVFGTWIAAFRPRSCWAQMRAAEPPVQYRWARPRGG